MMNREIIAMKLEWGIRRKEYVVIKKNYEKLWKIFKTFRKLGKNLGILRVFLDRYFKFSVPRKPFKKI
jgi:hypothetical protein